MRRVTSLVLLLAFLMVAVTGLALLAAEEHGPGRGAPPPGAMVGGPDGPGADADADGDEVRGPGGPPHHGIFPRPLHELSGLLLVLAGLLHIALNRRALLCYCGLRSGRRSSSVARTA